MSVRRSQEELTVITKTYELILWSCHHTGKFPRNHRFLLGERIERNLYDLLETLIRAKYSKPRQESLETANLMLEILRFPMRLAKDLQCPRSRATALRPRQLTGSANSSAAGSRAVAARHEAARQPLAACHQLRGAAACRRASLQGQAIPAQRGRLSLQPRTRTVDAARGTVHEDLPARSLPQLLYLR